MDSLATPDGADGGNSSGSARPTASVSGRRPEFVPEAIPQALAGPRTEWVVWGGEIPVGNGSIRKLDKCPRSPRGRFPRVRVNDGHWFRFEECRSAVRRNPDRLFGVGRMMTAGDDDIVGIDLDRVLADPRGEEFVRELQRSLPYAYFERSPSGTGIRVFAFAPGAIEALRRRRVQEVKRRDYPIEGANVELYANDRGGRYLTVTGAMVQAGDLAKDSTEAVLALVARLDAMIARQDSVSRRPRPLEDGPLDLDFLRSLLPILASWRAEDRDQWIRVGMACKAAGLAYGDWELFSRRCEWKFDEADCARRWKSLNPREAKASWLVAMAKEDSPESFRKACQAVGRMASRAVSPSDASGGLEDGLEDKIEPTDEGVPPVDDESPRDWAAETEFTCLEGFVARHRDRWRWIPERGCWFEWSGGWWRADDRGRIAGLARAEVERCFPPRMHTLQRRQTIVHAAQDPLREPLGRFDAHPDLLGVGGVGHERVVELRTGLVRTARPEDLILRSTGILPGGEAPVWERCIREWTDGDAKLARYLQLVTGYCLTASVDLQQFWILHGLGEDGKSTFIETVAAAMGPYAGGFNLAAVLAGDREVHPTSRAKLHGLRLAYTSECPSTGAWNEAAMKSLTGGDRITARFMYQDEFDFVPTHKFLIATNHLPAIRTGGKSWHRRIRVVPFRKRVAPQTDLKSVLRKELPGVLAWMIHGAVEALSVIDRGGTIEAPEAVAEAGRRYESTEDWFASCLADRFELDPPSDWFTPTSEILSEVARWAEANRVASMTGINARLIAQELQDRFGLRAGVATTAGRQRGYHGIRTKT